MKHYKYLSIFHYYYILTHAYRPPSEEELLYNMENSTNAFSCTLYKQQNSSWLECCRPTSLQISPYGLSFRETHTCALICDFPYISIIKVEILEKKICRLYMRNGKATNDVYGVLFHEEQHMNSIADDLTKRGVVCNRIASLDNASSSFESSFPNLDNQDVCDYIIQLLFNDEYQSFVNSVRELLNSIDDI